MRTAPLLIGGLAICLVGLFANDVYTNVGGAPAGRSGGAGELSCATSTCHSGTVNSGSGLLSITSDAPGGVYTPGLTYTITVTLQQASITRFGFEVLYGHSPTTNTSKGTGTITNATDTQHKSLSGKKYVTHRTAGTTGSGSRTWSFTWTAPNADEGPLSFYVAGNSTNNNGLRSGDLIYTNSMTLSPPPVAIDPAQAVELSLYPTLVEGPLHVQLNGLGLEPVEAVVLDATGKAIIREQWQPSGAEMLRSLDLSTATSGIYFVQVRAGSQIFVEKVLKH